VLELTGISGLAACLQGPVYQAACGEGLGTFAGRCWHPAPVPALGHRRGRARPGPTARPRVQPGHRGLLLPLRCTGAVSVFYIAMCMYTDTYVEREHYLVSIANQT